jgi:starch phosphorylase
MKTELNQRWRPLNRSQRQLAGASGGYAYTAWVPAARPAGDYTVRVAPHHDGVAVPLEAARILWQR